MNIKKILKNHFQFVLIAVAMIAIILLWSTHKSYSSDADQNAWDGTTIAMSFAGGNGSKENPYLISNGEELVYFKTVLEQDNTTYGNLSYELTSDIYHFKDKNKHKDYIASLHANEYYNI